MRKKIAVLFTWMLLVIGIVVETSYAESASYYTIARIPVCSVTNTQNYVKTAEFRPIHGGGIAQIQICNASGTIVLLSDTYPEYPQNHGTFQCSVPTYTTRRAYVKSLIDGQYVWGSIVYCIHD